MGVYAYNADVYVSSTMHLLRVVVRCTLDRALMAYAAAVYTRHINSQTTATDTQLSVITAHESFDYAYLFMSCYMGYITTLTQVRIITPLIILIMGTCL